MRYLIIVCSFITVQALAQQFVRLAPRIIKVNDKFGIVDENNKTVVSPENDTIIASFKNYLYVRSQKINPVFFIKKNDKFAYAYQVDLDTNIEVVDFPEEKIRWYTSEFVFDDIELISFGLETFNYIYKNNSSLERTFVVLKYLLKGKWGLIYIPGSKAADYSGFEVLGYPGNLGISRLTEPKYDTIGKLYQDGLYDVKINGKWALWQVVAVPSNGGLRDGKYITQKWVNYLYPEYFDSPPKTVGDSRSYGGKYFKPYYRFVKKEGKWGVIKINPDTTEMKYIVPCQCDTVAYSRYREEFNNSDIIFTCVQLKQNKISVYYNNQQLDIDLKVKPAVFLCASLNIIDTIPNEKMEAHLTYERIRLLDYDKIAKKEIDMGYCLVDLSRHSSTFFINDSVTNYELHFGYHDILIEKQIKTTLGTQYEYSDFEKGVKKIVIKPKANTNYRVSSRSIDDYPSIMEYKLGKDSKFKYYYDLKEKKFRKDKRKH